MDMMCITVPGGNSHQDLVKPNKSYIFVLNNRY